MKRALNGLVVLSVVAIVLVAISLQAATAMEHEHFGHGPGGPPMFFGGPGGVGLGIPFPLLMNAADPTPDQREKIRQIMAQRQ